MTGTVERAFEQLLPRYRDVPWLALLRAFEVAALAELVPSDPGPVLDLGCGDGFVARLAFGRQLDAGIDLDEKALIHARRAAAYRVACRASAERVPFKAGSFALVYSNGALEHMDALDSVLGEVQRVLWAGGRFVFLVPGERFRSPVGGPLSIAGKRLWTAVNSLHHHVNLLSEQEWTQRLGQAGLKVERIARYADRRAAAFIATRDAISKLHLGVRARPCLRHGGNLEKLAAAGATRRARRLARSALFDDDGYWLAVVARKL